MIEKKDFTLTEKANEALAAMAKEETKQALNRLLKNSAMHMKNGYNRADN